MIDFIGIGAQKAGTTWLYKNLEAMPQFSLPSMKEIHYFDRAVNYPSPDMLREPKAMKKIFSPYWAQKFGRKMYAAAKKSDWDEMKWLANSWFSNIDDDWYLSIFENLEGIKGEITPSYSMLERHDIEKMYAVAPQAKLILMLRNPVDRAWSHYRFHKGKGQYAMQHEEIMAFMKNDAQRRRSDFRTVIENYYSVYPANQILIGFYDAIKHQPKALLTEIVQFLGGDPKEIEAYCTLERKINVSKAVACPVEVRKELVDMYSDAVRDLAENFDGYFSYWQCVNENIEGTIDPKNLSPVLKLNTAPSFK
ncbi:MAG: sulfotransferase domain-containing protein [Weeksellaceae bacterium]|nr:sulfotransferase domain-containing protein [Weeksellaceae bacterium]